MPGQGQQRRRLGRGRYVQRAAPVLAALHAQRRLDVARTQVHGGRAILVCIHLFEQPGPGVTLVPPGPTTAEAQARSAARATARARFARLELFGKLVERRGRAAAATTARSTEANIATATASVADADATDALAPSVPPAGRRGPALSDASTVARQAVHDHADAAETDRSGRDHVVRLRAAAAAAATASLAADADNRTTDALAVAVRIVHLAHAHVALHHFRVAGHLQYVLGVVAPRLYVARRVAHPGHRGQPRPPVGCTDIARALERAHTHTLTRTRTRTHARTHRARPDTDERPKCRHERPRGCG